MALKIVGVDDVVSVFEEFAITRLALTNRLADAMAFNQPRDFNEQFFVAKGKIEIVVRAGVETFHSRVVRLANTADQKYGNVSRPRIFLQSPAKFQSANHRHHDIADDHIRTERMSQIETFRTIGRSGDFVTFEFEEFNQKIENPPVVVDDQYTAPV